MITQELLGYVKGEFAKGTTEEEIKNALMANGWDANDVKEAFAAVRPAQSQSEAKPEISVSVEQPMMVEQMPQVTPATLRQSSQSASPLHTSPMASPIQPTIQHPGPQEFSRKTPHTKALIVAALVGLLAIGGAAFAYMGGYISLPAFIATKQSPEKVVEKMTTNLADITSLEYSGEMKFETDTVVSPVASGEGEQKKSELPNVQNVQTRKDSFLVTWSGKSNLQKFSKPQGSFTFNITTDAFGEEDFSFAVELKMLDDALYVRLSDAPKVGIFDLSALKNEWIKIDLTQNGGQFGLGALGEKIKNQKELSDADEAKLTEAFKKAKFITVIKDRGEGELDGKAMHHYDFVLDKEGIKKFLAEVAVILNDTQLTAEEFAAFDKSLDIIAIQNAQIWIGKADFLPYKIYFESRTDDSTNVSTGAFTFFFSEFSAPVEIVAPTEVKSIEEVLGALFGATVEPKAVKAKESAPAKGTKR